jgi:hypothetical protein
LVGNQPDRCVVYVVGIIVIKKEKEEANDIFPAFHWLFEDLSCDQLLDEGLPVLLCREVGLVFDYLPKKLFYLLLSE